MNGYTPQQPRPITAKWRGEERFATILEALEIVPQTGHLYPVYQWVGDPHLPVRIKNARRHFPTLPWPMKQVGPMDFQSDSAVYVRADVRGAFWRPPFVALRYWARVNWDRFTMRAVATADIWGWADIPDGVMPSWRHIGRRKRGKK